MSRHNPFYIVNVLLFPITLIGYVVWLSAE